MKNDRVTADCVFNFCTKFDRTIRRNSAVYYFTEKLKLYIFLKKLNKLVSTFKIQIRAIDSILCHFVSLCVNLCHFVSLNVILCHFVSYGTYGEYCEYIRYGEYGEYYIILYYIILYYIIL